MLYRLVTCLIIIFTINFKVDAMTVIQVTSAPRLPLDPEKVQTMADYDLALCLYRTWFEYDRSRQAISGLVSSWKFDNKTGSYLFTIDKDSRWSDGSALTSEHLIKNLQRVIKNKSSYGAAIDAIIDIKNHKIVDEKNFILPTKNHKPSEAFFQRMGSIFLAVTHPKDWDKNGVLISNHFSIGPYKILEQTKTDLILGYHPYDRIGSEKRIKKIHIRLVGEKPTVEEFVKGSTFDNIISTYTLMPTATYKEILAHKLPFWTRAFDRVSYLSPIKSYPKNSDKLRNFVRLLGKKFYADRSFEIPMNVKVATSLQPKGYPLNDQLHYDLAAEQEKDLPKEVSIVTVAGFHYEYQKSVIEKLVKTMGVPVKLNWTAKPTMNDFLAELNENSSYDLQISSFGVADPEAATWLSLVLNKDAPFVEISAGDTANFEGILKKHLGRDGEVLELKKMLTKIGERGSYLPLFHFSTMSISQPGISFENIHELDETVDYSKLIIK